MFPFRRGNRLQRVIGFVNFRRLSVNKRLPSGVVFFAQHNQAIRRHRGLHRDRSRLIVRDFDMRGRRWHVFLCHLFRRTLFQHDKLAEIYLRMQQHLERLVFRGGNKRIMHGIGARKRIQVFQQQRVGIHDDFIRLNHVADFDRLLVQRRAFREDDIFDIQQVN